jgi:dihydrolipoamide dehydrogenase
MERYDVAVIGGGPAGYVAAIRCAQLGMRTACIDDWRRKDRPSLGGTCLNVGCIPSKALLDSSEKFELIGELKDHGITVSGKSLDLGAMMARKEAVVDRLTSGIALLFRKYKVDSLPGLGRLIGRDGEFWKLAAGAEELQARRIILATGSVPRPLPSLPFDGERVVDSEGALSFASVPPRLTVVGAGVVGLELGSVWRRLGSQVTVLEAMGEFLPAADRDLAKEALRRFSEQGLDIQLGVEVQSAEPAGDSLRLRYRAVSDQELECDRIIVAVGRVPRTSGLGGDQLGLELDSRGFIKVDAQFRTNLPEVFAIGDVIGGPMLAHKAQEEGVALAERLAGQAGAVNYRAVPWVVYTEPELAWVGQSEQELRDRGHAVKVGRFPMSANGRALGSGEASGFVKVVADAATDRLLGVHIVSHDASELIAEAVSVMEFGGSSEDLGRTIHAHPTRSEALKEAALAVLKLGIHL